LFCQVKCSVGYIKSRTWGIYKKLVSSEYKNVGPKKAALFIRAITVLNGNGLNELFSKFKWRKDDLYIPLDIVISDILNRLLNIKFTSKFKIIPYKDFYIVNEFSKFVLDDEFMLLEDLWYWGYFNMRVEKNAYREVQFNEEKFYSTPFIYPNEDLIPVHKEFVKCIK